MSSDDAPWCQAKEEDMIANVTNNNFMIYLVHNFTGIALSLESFSFHFSLHNSTFFPLLTETQTNKSFPTNNIQGF